jgi:N-methylhydantoinase B
VVDFTQSAPEQAGPVNCPLASTVSAARMAIMALAGGREYVNEGHFRPVEVRAREGTMYHPRPPAPVYLYYWAAVQAIDVIHRSLGESMPELIAAGSAGDICCVVWWGWDEDGKMWGDASNHPSGQGASATSDGGAPLVHISSAGMRNSPAEVWEVRHAMLIEELEYATDSSGAGAYRGGLGIRQRYRALRDTYMTTTIERTRTPPWGLAGGGEGRPNRGAIRYPDGRVEPCAKATGVKLPAGAVLEIFIGSGGGYGPPAERDPTAVRADLRAGYMSEAEARRLYPHAFDGGRG